MEEKVFKPKVRKGRAVYFILIGIVYFALITMLFVALSKSHSNYTILSFIIPVVSLNLLLTILFLLRINIRRIVVSDRICIERYLFGPKTLSFSDFDYIEGGIIVFKNYTIYADNFTNVAELTDIMSELGSRGIFELKGRSQQRIRREKKSRRAINILSIVLLSFFLAFLIMYMITNYWSPVLAITCILITPLLIWIRTIQYRNRNI